MNDNERITMVKSCKFVSEVVPDCPYVMSQEYLDHIIETYQVDYVVHGDDPCIVDGKDVYASAKRKGKYLSIPRTEGVSTTDFIGRMLLLTKEHHHKVRSNKEGHDTVANAVEDETSVLGRQSKFLTTSRMLKLFSADVTTPPKDAKIVYIDGSWDMYHPGHVAILKEAKARGDYLLVGVYGDSLSNDMYGSNLPLMNLHERVLSVLGCGYVDDVLIDAPYVVTRDMVASLNLSVVVHGVSPNDEQRNFENRLENDRERYRVPKELGIFQEIQTNCDFSIRKIISRIQKNHDVFQAKFDRKSRMEKEFYEEKHADNITEKGQQ